MPRKQSAIPGTLWVPQSEFVNPQSQIRNGISLMEVLISMFVMLFGLMGVAAIFPVGNYYVVEGEKHDLGSLLAAIIIGLVFAFSLLIAPELGTVLTFLIMAVVLSFRPWGLRGSPE